MLPESVVPNTTNEGGNYGTKALDAPASPMAAEPSPTGAGGVPNSTDDGRCDALAVVKAQLAAKEREVVETMAKVDDLTARLAGLDETLEALRKEKDQKLANVVAEKDKRIDELEAALALSDTRDGADRDAPSSSSAPAPASAPVASRRFKMVSSKAREGANSHFVTSTPINKDKGKPKARHVCRSSMAELNSAKDDDEPSPRAAVSKKKAARPSRGRSGRKASSNAKLKHRGPKKTKREFDVPTYTNPNWSKYAFFNAYKIDSKEKFSDFVHAYKLRAHRGVLKDTARKWYPRASRYEVDDICRLLDNPNREGKYDIHNIESLLDYLGEDEGEDFGKGDKPYYSRAHRIASLLFKKWPVTSDRKSFDVSLAEGDGNTGDDYIYERARKFCTALNTMKMLHGIWTGEFEDIEPWQPGQPTTKPKSCKRARRVTDASDAAPSAKRGGRRGAPADTDDESEEEAEEGAEEREGEEEDSDDDDEDEGEDDDDSSSSENGAPSEEELAKYAEECLAVGREARSHAAAVAKWHERFPLGSRHAPEPPWKDDKTWGHAVELDEDEWEGVEE